MQPGKPNNNNKSGMYVQLLRLHANKKVYNTTRDISSRYNDKIGYTLI